MPNWERALRAKPSLVVSEPSQSPARLGDLRASPSRRQARLGSARCQACFQFLPSYRQNRKFYHGRTSGLGFGRVCPMPRPESDRDFSDPVVFGQRNLFQPRTWIGFGLKHPNCQSDRSVFNFYPEKCRVGAEIESAGPTFKYEMGSAYLSLI